MSESNISDAILKVTLNARAEHIKSRVGSLRSTAW